MQFWFMIDLVCLSQEDIQNLSTASNGDKSDDLIRVLRELTSVQRNISNLQVELQGRKVTMQNFLQQTYSFEVKTHTHTLLLYTWAFRKREPGDV